MREASLEGADLSGANGGLRTEQLAGADLTGAMLPEQLKELYDGLQNVKNISERARKLFLAVLTACLYSWLTIATTTDLNLITNRASSQLPIIQTSIPIVGFYVVAPLLLLCVYFYFHFYLQKLWEELGCLPAVFPDGRPVHTKVDPWLLNDLVRSHLPKLNVNRPFLSYLQLWISVLLAWWMVPITMLLFWVRYLRRHERTGTTLHVVLLVLSLVAAVCLYRLAVATLRGAERRRFTWKGLFASRRGYQTAAFATAVGVLFGLFSWGAIAGVPFGAYKGPRAWIPRAMSFMGYPNYANLHGAEISQKKSTSSSNNDKDPVGAQLGEADLQFADAERAFFAGASLSRANLSGADLFFANLSGANLFAAYLRDAYLVDVNLSGADLIRADLSGADLSNANLSGADMSGANLSGAILPDALMDYSDLRSVKNLDPKEVKRMRDWDRAFYDDETLRVLGLPSDHNDKLADERKKEEELQQKQNVR